MALKVKLKSPTGRHSLVSLLISTLLIGIGVCVIIAGTVGGYFYFKYGGVVDERLKHPLFTNTAQIYAAPREVRIGQKLSVGLISNELRQAGYTDGSAEKKSPL